jgi:non-specific serine/threonine protein kinase
VRALRGRARRRRRRTPLPPAVGFRRGGDERAGGAFWWGAAAHYLGTLASVLARWDAAAAHFEEALRAGAAAGAVLEIRRTQLAYIRLLLARGAPGDDGKAEHLLAELIASLHLPRAALAPGALIGADGVEAGPATPIGTAGGPSHYLFRREADYWTIAAEGRVSRLRSLRGFDYIAELLRHPHEQIYVVDLAACGVPGENRLSAEEAAEHGLRVSAETGAMPMLDRRAREDYRARWRELLVEQADARRDNDVGRAARIEREIEMLATQLAAASGGGRGGRSGPSDKERARVNVRNCITAALRAVVQHDEPLGRHLANSIKTGSFCCYAPDRAVVWEM